MAREEHALPCPKIERGQKKLTPEQAAYARQFALERIAAMLSTDSIDEAEAEEHLRAAYRVAGREPVPVRWFDSPLSFVLAHSSGMWTCIGDGIWNGLWYRVEGSLWHNGWDSVGNRVRDIVRDIVRDSIWDGLWHSVEGSLWHNGWDSVGNRVRDSAREIAEDSAEAYSNEDWLSCYRFFHEIFESNDMIHLALFNEMVSGYRLGGNEAWVVRKPIRLARDEQGDLHSADGMCVQYRDGWGFYAWHGTNRCPEKIILHPEQITRVEWMNEPNLEIRRIMQERLGPDRFIALVGGTCLDRGPRGELIAVDLGDDPEEVAHYVHVQDASTERQYYLRVPPTITSADEAVAWTFGLDAHEYQPVQET